MPITRLDWSRDAREALDGTFKLKRPGTNFITVQTAIDDGRGRNFTRPSGTPALGRLPREAQEMLFESAVENANHMRKSLFSTTDTLEPSTRPIVTAPTSEDAILASDDAANSDQKVTK